MGAGQIGGIATMLDIDFKNAAGFIGEPARIVEAQFMVYYLSHTMMFCTGALIEAHVVLTPAICIYGERYKFDVFAGTHKFLEGAGSPRLVQHLCVHKGYNHTMRWATCSPDNLALLILNQQYSFNKREDNTGYIINRLRYGALALKDEALYKERTCKFYGWGSRRNGYLIPLLLDLYRVDVQILPQEKCQQMWNYEDKFLCLLHPPCKTEKHGALCPDDVGSVIVCNGFLQGMMVSRIIDRPCGIGFLDMNRYLKFLTCGVDDSRDVVTHESFMAIDMNTPKNARTPRVYTADFVKDSSEEVTTPYRVGTTTPENYD